MNKIIQVRTMNERDQKKKILQKLSSFQVQIDKIYRDIDYGYLILSHHNLN